MSKPIPYDDDQEEEKDERDERWVGIEDADAYDLMQGWTGGQSDPLYAIVSMNGANYAWVFVDAIANIDRDLSRVKKVGRDKFQLGKGTFTGKEIDELQQIRDALQEGLDAGGEVREARRGVVRAPRAGRVRQQAERGTSEKWEHNAQTGNSILKISSNERIIRDTHRPPLYKAEFWGDYSLDYPISGGWRGTLQQAKDDLKRLAHQRSRNASHSVRDYAVVDRQDRTVAGPFKSYQDARNAAGGAGAVKFVPTKTREAHATRVNAYELPPGVVPKFKVGSRVVMSPDALENYGERWQGIVFKITHVATGRADHPGFDPGAGSALYDLAIDLTGEPFNNSLYDWELEWSPTSVKPHRRPKTREASRS